jgi:UDP-N-acetyl-2-amino-2-deoxyglucuronate dehydrogenase
MSDTGFGIIGCGVGATFHLKGIRSAQNAKLIAVADMDSQKAMKFAKENNIPVWYDDYKKLLNRLDIEIVCICTPSGLHSDVAVEAAKAGKHIICEKPMDITLPAADRMIKAAEQAKVKLGIVLQWRSYDSMQKVRQAVREGWLGKMVLGDAYLKYYRAQGYYDSAVWRGTWAMDGGGALMNQGIHGIDILQWIMGDVETVYARADHLVRNIEGEDTAVAVVTYKSGAYGTIIGTTAAFPAEDPRLQFHGELGTILMEEQIIKKWVVQGRDGNPKDMTPQSDITKIGGISDPTTLETCGHEKIIQNMLDALRYNQELYCSGIEGRKSIELILAIYESAKTGKEVKLPL